VTDARYQQSPKGREMQRSAQQRYSRTPKGRERTWRYHQTWKRDDARRRYEESPKGHATRSEYALRRGPSTAELLERSRRTPIF
jgi:hypothetical protein